MKKTLRITLDVEVESLPEDEIKQYNRDLGITDENDNFIEGGIFTEDDIPTPDNAFDEASADVLADIATSLFDQEAVREAFGGSDLYVTFKSDPKVVSAEYI